MDLISVIIPYYNSEKFLTETLLSLKKQTYVHWECLLVDDGSDDRSHSICESFSREDKRFRLLKRKQRSKGPSSCRNIGLESANGIYVIFLDSDDLLADHALESRINRYQMNNNFDFIVFQSAFLKSPETGLVPYSQDYLGLFLKFEFPWQATCPLWKRSFLVKLGGFNENLLLLEDPELHIRALLNSDKFEVLSEKEPDFFYRTGIKKEKKRGQYYEKKIINYLNYLEIVSGFQKLKSDQRKKLKNGIVILIAELIKPLNNTEVEKLIVYFKNYKTNRLINRFTYSNLMLVFTFLKLNKNKVINKLLLFYASLTVSVLFTIKNIFKYKLKNVKSNTN